MFTAIEEKLSALPQPEAPVSGDAHTGAEGIGRIWKRPDEWVRTAQAFMLQ